MPGNVIGNTDVADFNPVILATEILKAMRPRIVLGNQGFKDFSQDLAEDGDTVQVTKVSSFKAFDKLSGQRAQSQKFSTGHVHVTLNHHAYVQITIEDAARAMSNKSQLSETVGQIAGELVKRYETDLANEFDNPDITSDITYATSISSVEVKQAAMYFDKEYLDDRVMVSCIDDYYTLLDDDDFKGADSINAQILTEGVVGRMSGVSVMKTPVFKQYSAVFSKLAIAIATRVLRPSEGATKSQVITDTETGFSLRYTLTWDPHEMADIITFDFLYGFKVVEPLWVKRIRKNTTTNAFLHDLVPSTGILSPEFDPATYSYTLQIDWDISGIKIQPMAEFPDTTITVNGQPVVSGQMSQELSLVKDALTTITVVTTAADGMTSKTYTIGVTRGEIPPTSIPGDNAELSALTISEGTLTPSFDKDEHTYTDSVANGITSVTVTPTSYDDDSIIIVNGSVVESGEASGAISLEVGENLITIIVLAEDRETTETYTITVTRAAP